MKTEDFLKIIKNDIHTTVMATVDEMGHTAEKEWTKRKHPFI